MRLPNQSLAVSHVRHFYAALVKSNQVLIRASLHPIIYSPGEGAIYVPDQVPRVAYASTALECGFFGSTTYTLSTGSDNGECKISDGEAKCSDSQGNSASADCDGCNVTSGTGSCTIKA
jgi:hypothetical protein